MRRQYMGYSMRTGQWRFTQWFEWDGDNLAPFWDHVVGTELYDHSTDDGTAAMIDQFENDNLAVQSKYAATVKQLSAQLKTEVSKWITPNPTATHQG